MTTASLYLITYDYFDRKIERRMTGTHDHDKHTRDGVVREIASGYVTGVDRIYECKPGDLKGTGSCIDITADIARDVATRLINERDAVDAEIAEWLHRMHPEGVRSTRGMILAA